MLVFWLIENQEQDDAVKEQRFFYLLVLLRYHPTAMLVLWEGVLVNHEDLSNRFLSQ